MRLDAVCRRQLIANYQTHLPEKALLTNKLRELRELAEAEGFAEDEEVEDDWDVYTFHK